MRKITVYAAMLLKLSMKYQIVFIQLLLLI